MAGTCLAALFILISESLVSVQPFSEMTSTIALNHLIRSGQENIESLKQIDKQ
jgi:hypothetical protein